MADQFPIIPPLGPAPWPSFFTPPRELLDWLSQENERLTNGDACLARHVRTLRWLVLAELDRTAPQAPERGPPGAGPVDFTSPVV